MTCPAIPSGSGFLTGTLNYLDCAGQQLGAAGYQALAAPGSVIFSILLALLTLFIAWQGLKLMFGRPLDLGDAVMAAAKIGLVLMLATSWPAVKVLLHDTVVRGPSELVQQMGAAPGTIEQRLQDVDNGIVALTSWGTGKLDIRAGRTADGTPAAAAFTGEALNESLALGTGRLFLLTAVIGTLGLLALMAGVLLSLLPLFAGFLLFDSTRGLFIGWLRAWSAVFVGSIAVPVLLAIEAGMLESWLTRVVSERQASLATPSAPIELMAMTTAFLLITVGSLILISRACFTADPVAIRAWAERVVHPARTNDRPGAVNDNELSRASSSRSTLTRAEQLSSLLAITARSEAQTASTSGSFRESGRHRAESDQSAAPRGRGATGSRRTQGRPSRSSIRRDRR